VLVIATISAVVLSKAPEDPAPGVVDITSANVDTILDGSRNALVEFYAPWCGHCKTLAPEYAIAGEAYEKAKPKDTVLAKINCDAESAVCQKYGVKGYPTLKWFNKGATEPVDYDAGRTADDIVKYINNKDSGARLRIQKAPSHVVDLDSSNFDRVVKDADKDVLVEFYAPWCGHCKKLAPEWEKAATAFRNEKHVVVAKVDCDTHKDVGSKYGIQGFPTIKFFPRSNKAGEDYNAGRDADAIVAYLNEKAGTHRTVTGQLTATAGLVEKFNDIVSKFVAETDKSAREKIIKQGEDVLKTIEDSTKSHAEHYVRVMKSILEKGEDYATKEFERVGKIIGSGQVGDDRADAMKVRHNILNLFKKKE
jgi:protein disulfide-isomerase A6